MKYAGLSEYLMKRQLEIEQKYTNDLSKINKDVFSNKGKIKISIKGLFKFKFLTNCLIHIFGVGGGLFPPDRTKQDLEEYQQILSASAMFDARNPEGELAVPREIAIEVCQKEKALRNLIDFIRADKSKSKTNTEYTKTNKLFVDSLMLSLNSKSDKVYKYYMPETSNTINKWMELING
jgi:hypothetical protein